MVDEQKEALMQSESERLQAELEPLELVKPSIETQIKEVTAEIVAEMVKRGMEQQDAVRFVEMSELRMSLEKRYDYILGSDMSDRVKKARLNLTRKEMETLLVELSAMREKYEKRKAEEDARNGTKTEAGSDGRGDQGSTAQG